MSQNIETDRVTDDLLWGAAAIARYINRDRRAVYYLISKQIIPAKKLGFRTICARKSELDAFLRGETRRSSSPAPVRE
jgi:hypothetical protein